MRGMVVGQGGRSSGVLLYTGFSQCREHTVNKRLYCLIGLSQPDVIFILNLAGYFTSIGLNKQIRRIPSGFIHLEVKHIKSVHTIFLEFFKHFHVENLVLN